MLDIRRQFKKHVLENYIYKLHNLEDVPNHFHYMYNQYDPKYQLLNINNEQQKWLQTKSL